MANSDRSLKLDFFIKSTRFVHEIINITILLVEIYEME